VRLVRASVTRTLPAEAAAEAAVAATPRGRWRTGDYAVAQVEGSRTPAWQVETTSGRFAQVGDGDLVLGALGSRRATLESVGDWREVGDDLAMTTLTRAGVLGRCTSAAPQVWPLLVPLRYRGHLVLAGRVLRMADHALPARPRPARLPPAILMVGSSMSAGKTTTATAVIRRATRMGLSVAGAKLAGVGRYGDILAMRDAGADPVLDFVDAGLPATLGPEAEVADAIERVLAAVAASGADLLVAEAGASPLEPYHGELAIVALGDSLALTVLCASDAYAARGTIGVLPREPDFVAGRAAATSAGVELVRRLTGLEALDATSPEGAERIDAHLQRALAGARPPSGTPT
jgi:hypothetical protein